MSETSTQGSLLSALMGDPVLVPCQSHEEITNFLLGRVPPFDLPDLNGWVAEAARIRNRVLDEVIFKGIPEEWRQRDPEVIWGEVIETGHGYRIRKLRYPALPDLWVPALLYEPDTLDGNTPAVLNVNGHVGPPGKAIDYKQIRCINLAKRGILALNPEWLYFGELRSSGFRHNQSGHLDLCGTAGIGVFYLAMQRGLDVLMDHANTDPERVAVTGLSGGGWQTIILSALDTRVKLAAPNAGYIGLDFRVKNRGDIGDIEQNPTDLATIADYPMLTAMLAPRPTLLLYNAQDDCCFKAERAYPSVYEPVKPLFEAMGVGDSFQFHSNIDPGNHNYEIDHRQQFYRFINKHFLADKETLDEEISSEDEVLTEEELTVGLPGKNVDFLTLARRLHEGIPHNRLPDGDTDEIRKWQLSGKESLKHILRYETCEITNLQTAGERTRGEYLVKRYTLRIGDQWTLPLTDISTTRTGADLLLVTADQGKASAEALVEKALDEGQRVLLIDVLLQGECKPQATPGHQYAMMASAAGYRILGIQAAQLAAVSTWATGFYGSSRIQLAGNGPVSSVLMLCSAALSGVTVENILLVDPLASLKQLSEKAMLYDESPSLFCFGLLEAFDVRELIGLVAPTPITIGKPHADLPRINAEWNPLSEYYERLGTRDFHPWSE